MAMKSLFILASILICSQVFGQKIDSLLVEVDDGPNWDYYESTKYNYDVNGHLINQLTKH